MQDVANVGPTDYFNQHYKQHIGWTNLPHVPICPSLPYCNQWKIKKGHDVEMAKKTYRLPLFLPKIMTYLQRL